MTTKEQWRELGIYNPYNLVERYAAETGEYGVYLSKSVNDGSRMNMGVPHGWVVGRFGYKTNPASTGYRDQDKTFHIFGTNWDAALEEAARWTAERYSLSGEFVAIPGFGGNRFPIEVAEWAKTYPRKVNKGEGASND